VAPLQAAIQAFLSDLQATPAPSRFASTRDRLRVDLEAEQQALRDWKAGYGARDETAVRVAKHNLTVYETALNQDAADALYAR
jgi:hypothetical protein